MADLRNVLRRDSISSPYEYAINTALNSDFKPKIRIIHYVDDKAVSDVLRLKKEKAKPVKEKPTPKEKDKVKEKVGAQGARPHKIEQKNNNNRKNPEAKLPKETFGSITSGIDPKVIIDKNSGFNGEYSRLFIMNGSFINQQTNYDKSAFYEHFYRNVFTEYQLAVQFALGNRSFTKFSSDELFDYFHRLTFGLEVYYQIDSILAYFDDDSNRPFNEGMVALRSRIDADSLDDFRELGDVLKDMPCPPNLLHFIRHMYQNFVFSEKDDTIYRLCYEFSFYDDHSKDGAPSVIADAISSLKDFNISIPVLINRTFNGLKIDKLPPSSSKPILDNDFRSFWTNCTVSYFKSGLTYFTRKVDSSDEQFNYILYDDNVDGLIYSSVSIQNTMTGVIETGLWTPVMDPDIYKDVNTEQMTSVLFFDQSIKQFRSINNLACLTQSSLYHGIVRSVPSGSSEPVFVDVVNSQVGSLRTIMNSVSKCKDICYESIRYLLSVRNSFIE